MLDWLSFNYKIDPLSAELHCQLCNFQFFVLIQFLLVRILNKLDLDLMITPWILCQKNLHISMPRLNWMRYSNYGFVLVKLCFTCQHLNFIFRQWLFRRRWQFALGIYFAMIIHVCLYSQICYYCTSDSVV